jgi:heat shock protein HslJ
MFRAALFLPFLISACQDETLSGFVGDASRWELVELDVNRFEASATLDLREQGRVSGSAPCNSYSASQSAPYPWFELGAIMSTKRACQALADETAFFRALKSMTISEVSGGSLILSNEAGGQMVFSAISE